MQTKGEKDGFVRFWEEKEDKVTESKSGDREMEREGERKKPRGLGERYGEREGPGRRRI
jgi:hypothetical protein